jgi:hypothetical protein
MYVYVYNERYIDLHTCIQLKVHRSAYIQICIYIFMYIYLPIYLPIYGHIYIHINTIYIIQIYTIYKKKIQIHTYKYYILKKDKLFVYIYV